MPADLHDCPIPENPSSTIQEKNIGREKLPIKPMTRRVEQVHY